MGRKVSGRKCHIVVDTAGLLLAVVVRAANIEDRAGAKLVGWWCGLGRLTAGRGASESGQPPFWGVDPAVGGGAHPGLVEPVLAAQQALVWLSWRLSKSYEELPETGEARGHVAMVHLILKRLKPT